MYSNPVQCSWADFFLLSSQHMRVPGVGVDLDQVNKKLMTLSDTPVGHMPFFFGAPTGVVDPDTECFSGSAAFDDWELEEDDVNLGKKATAMEMQNEEDCHARLLAMGGRPLYDIRKLPEIVKDSNGHFELVKAIQYEKGGGVPYWTDVFSTQAAHFQSFQWCRYREHRASLEKLDEFNKAMEPLQRIVGITPPFTFMENVQDQDALTEWVEYICYTMKDYPQVRLPLSRFRETQQHWAWYLCWLVDQIPIIRQEMAEADLKRHQGQEEQEEQEEKGEKEEKEKGEREKEVTTVTSVVSVSVNENTTATGSGARSPIAAFDPVGGDPTSSQTSVVSAPVKKRARKRPNEAGIPTRRSKRIATSAAVHRKEELQVVPPEPKSALRRKRPVSSSDVHKPKRPLKA